MARTVAELEQELAARDAKIALLEANQKAGPSPVVLLYCRDVAVGQRASRGKTVGQGMVIAIARREFIFGRHNADGTDTVTDIESIKTPHLSAVAQALA